MQDHYDSPHTLRVTKIGPKKVACILTSRYQLLGYEYVHTMRLPSSWDPPKIGPKITDSVMRTVARQQALYLLDYDLDATHESATARVALVGYRTIFNDLMILDRHPPQPGSWPVGFMHPGGGWVGVLVRKTTAQIAEIPGLSPKNFRQVIVRYYCAVGGHQICVPHYYTLACASKTPSIDSVAGALTQAGFFVPPGVDWSTGQEHQIMPTKFLDPKIAIRTELEKPQYQQLFTEDPKP